MMPFFILPQDEDPGPDKLEYNISVNVKLLPVFAVDNSGNPVFDLDKNEIELVVNGKPYDITYFKRYDFESSSIEKKTEVREEQERVVFIILDTMFCSNKGFRYSRQIAADMIRQGKPGDQFVIFENNTVGGLKHIVGPSDDREKIIKKIEKLRRPVDRWASQLNQRRNMSNNIDFSILSDARLETIGWESLRELDMTSESMRYKFQVKQFSRVLSDFKYILKTISKPKLVFLISEGMADEAFKIKFKGDRPQTAGITKESDAQLVAQRFQSILVRDEKSAAEDNSVYSTNLYMYLKDLVKSINYGGSVIHTINPRRLNDTNDPGVSGEMSLKFLAGESGGKYFAGSDTEEIAKRIDKTTSAYYEMVFYTDPDAGEKLQVEINCKRKGVKVFTTNYTEGSRFYRDMDLLQKKMFAFNVVTGGQWSRTSGKVMRIPFKKTKNGEIEKQNVYTLDIPLPNQMKNKKLDIFLIQRDPESNKVELRLVKKDAKNWVKLNVNPDDKKEQYFVIIEPVHTFCIYNKT